MTGAGDTASTCNDLSSGSHIVTGQNVVVGGSVGTVQVNSVIRSRQAAWQRQAVELWQMLREHSPAETPTPLDVLIAEVIAGAEVLDAGTINRRLQQAADAGQEQLPWREIINRLSTRQTLAGVLRALSLLEHTSLGSPGARRLRDQPDDDLIAEILDTAQALQRPRSPLDLQHALIMAVDITGFSNPDRPDRDRLALRDAMYQVLQQAVDHSIEAGWGNLHTEDRGDGMLLVFPQHPSTVEFLRLIDQLGLQVRQYNRVRTAKTALHLRMAAHSGLVRADEHGILGQAIHLTSRLLEAPVAKRAIAEAGACLTMVLSDSLYIDGLSQTGSDRSSSPILAEKFQPVDVSVKETSARGWLLVDVDDQSLLAARGQRSVFEPPSVGVDSVHADPPALVRRRVVEEQLLSEEEIQMLTQIASGATADIAARNLELSARTLRRRLRLICEKLEVDTPIEAVVWAVRRHLI